MVRGPGKAGAAALRLVDGATAHQTTEQQASQTGAVPFGHAVAQLFSEVTTRLLLDVETRRLPLQPVRSGWNAAGPSLAAQLSLLPLHVEGDLVADVTQSSVRRFVGLACLDVVEILLGVVLALTFWRMGTGFLFGEYLSGPLQMFNAASLICTLIFTGHIIANLFFPSLRSRFAKELARRTESMVAATWRNAQSLLKEHIDAVDRLAQRGRELLQVIDQQIQSLTSQAGDESELQRLFGNEAPLSGESSPPSHAHVSSNQEKIPKFE